MIEAYSMKHALFRLESYPEFSNLFVVNGIDSKTLSVMFWISQTFKIKSITECMTLSDSLLYILMIWNEY